MIVENRFPVPHLFWISCEVTATAGWCPTTTPTTGACTAPPDCCCGHPGADGTPAVLLQHRAAWSHQGGTWGLPGGALDSHGSRRARRSPWEAHEEAGLSAEHITVRTAVVTAEVSDRRGPGPPHHGRRRRGGASGDRAQPGERRTAVGTRGPGGRSAAAPRLRPELVAAADRRRRARP